MTSGIAAGGQKAQVHQDQVAYRASHDRMMVDISTVKKPRKRPWERFRLRDRGGILVPVGRSFAEDLPGLRHAAHLAQRHDCMLVVICSREASADTFPPDLRRDLSDRLILLDLKRVHESWLPNLACRSHRLSRLKRENDVGSKRNLGLVLAKYLGWQYVLFMDDDVSPRQGPTLDDAGLSTALEDMEQNPERLSTGWQLKDFDDNSVVGHARPFAGMDQEVFIGSGALLVRCSGEVSFFPDIYNEDWLFLIRQSTLSSNYKRALGCAGTVRQRRYDEFTKARARSEEVGEVLGEGLMTRLEDDGSAVLVQATAAFWEEVMEERLELLRAINTRVHEKVKALPPERDRTPAQVEEEKLLSGIMECMRVAGSVHSFFLPQELGTYTQDWWDDQEVWSQHLAELAEHPSGPMTPASISSLLRALRPRVRSLVSR